LQNRCKNYPEKIWDLDIGYPAGMRKDGQHRPDKRGQNQENIQRGQIIIFEPELNRSKRKIENEIEDERQDDYGWNFFLPSHQKNFAKRYGNKDIKKCPNRSKKPGRRRPGRFYQFLIPFKIFHA